MIVPEIVITEIPVKSHGKAFGVPNVSRPVHLKSAERARFNFQDRVGAVSVQLGKSKWQMQTPSLPSVEFS